MLNALHHQSHHVTQMRLISHEALIPPNTLHRVILAKARKLPPIIMMRRYLRFVLANRRAVDGHVKPIAVLIFAGKIHLLDFACDWLATLVGPVEPSVSRHARGRKTTRIPAAGRSAECPEEESPSVSFGGLVAFDQWRSVTVSADAARLWWQ